MEDRVILDFMNDLILPPGRYPENFMLISLLEVCQEGGVKKGGTCRMLRVPDWKAWRTGSSMTLWMYLVDPKDHILKVSCYYLYFWLKYKHMSRLSQNVTTHNIHQTDTAQIYIRYNQLKNVSKHVLILFHNLVKMSFLIL